MDKGEVLNKWTKFYDRLYNYEIEPDTSSIQADKYSTEGINNPLIMDEGVEAEVWILKPDR